MFTQSMPALAQALSGALPEAALRQLMQALGNCQQPLTHRGAVNLQPPSATGPGGLARSGVWRASDYRDILPTAGQGAAVYLPGYGGMGGGTINNTSNYDGNQFSFPINQEFGYNNYFGGDTFNVAGNSTFNNTFSTNLTTSTLTTSNINATYINNTPIGPSDGGGFSGFGGGPGGVFTGGGPGGVVFVGGGGGGGNPNVGRKMAIRTVVTKVEDKATGKVSIPNVTGLTVKSTAVTVNAKNTDVKITTTGSIDAPTVTSAKTKSGSATGKATVPTVTGASLSEAKATGSIKYVVYDSATVSELTGKVSVPTGGSLSDAKASGSISYDVYKSATVSNLSGTVDVPTSGSFTATPSGIAAECTIDGLEGSITIPVVTGGSLDADCKLNLTTKEQTIKVKFSGSPTCKVTSQGTVSGTVSLSGTSQKTVNITAPTIELTKSSGSATASLSVTGSVTLSGSSEATVTIPAPTIKLNEASGTADADLSVSGGKISLTPGTQQADVSITVPALDVDLTPGTENVPVTTTGTASVLYPDGTGELTSGEVDFETIYESKSVDVTVKSTSESISFLKPN